MSEIETFALEVTKELRELEALGTKVPAGAYKRAADLTEMEEYADGSMSVSDCADLLMSLG